MTTETSETCASEARVRVYGRMLLPTFGIIGLALAASVVQICKSEVDAQSRVLSEMASF